MAWKPGPKETDFSRLHISLLNARLQEKDNALFQTLTQLIDKIEDSRDSLNGGILALTALIGAPGSGGGLANATYLTENDETAILANSRRLLAGLGIAFDDTVAGIRTISATGVAGMGYWTPLTDGDVDETQLIFAAGEAIAVFVPT